MRNCENQKQAQIKATRLCDGIQIRQEGRARACATALTSCQFPQTLKKTSLRVAVEDPQRILVSLGRYCDAIQ
jgi:hypothetical protein